MINDNYIENHRLRSVSNGMKAIFIGTDRKLFEQENPVLSRSIEYARKMEELHIVVFSLSKYGYKYRYINNLHIYPTNSKTRMNYIFDAVKLGKKIIIENKLVRGQSVISTQDPFESGLSGYLLQKKFHLPLQAQIHTDFLSPYFKNSFLNYIRVYLAVFLLPHADGLRVVSSVIKDSLNKKFPNIKAKIDILPVFIDVEEIISREDKFYKPERTGSKILMVSRFTKEKRVDIGLEVFKKVLDGYKKNVDMTIIGYGPEKKNLEVKKGKLNLGDEVRILEWQKDVISAYKVADIFLLTSEYEGYGMTLIEAGAAGCPIVTTDVGIARTDLFRNGENSFVCPVGDVECLSKSIIQLISNDSLRKKFAEKMKENIQSLSISKEQYIAKYVGLLENLVEKDSNLKKSHFAPDVFTFLTKHVVIRYVLSGGVAGMTTIFLLYLFNAIFGIYYLTSSVLAYIGGFGVSFTLQKFWTFKSHQENTSKQLAMYFGTSLLGLVLNTFFMYLFVEHIFVNILLYSMHLKVLISQIITGLLVACFTFFISRNIVFKYKPK